MTFEKEHHTEAENIMNAFTELQARSIDRNLLKEIILKEINTCIDLGLSTQGLKQLLKRLKL